MNNLDGFRLMDRQLSIRDEEGQLDMARGYESFIEKCQHCGYDEQPNFKEETRMAYREVGEEGSFGYSRSICCKQEVLVCLSCGEVHRVVSEIY